MRRFASLILPMIFAMVGSLALCAPARAASSGVEDNAGMFSKDAVSKAEDTIRSIHSADDRDVFITTFDAIPADKQDQFDSGSKDALYTAWAKSIGKKNHVNGIVILLVKNPGRLQIVVGDKTSQHSFVEADRAALVDRMNSFLKQHQFDDALLNGVDFIKDKMQRSQPSAGNMPYSTSTNGGGSTNLPAPMSTHSSGSPVFGLLCLGVIILGAVFLIMKFVNRSRNYGGGYNAPPGGYPPGYGGGGYPQGGGYGYGGGGGGGGFGRGLLGGLLGGALGAWGYERFNQPSQPNSPQNPGSSGANFGNSSDQNDTNYSGGGADFGSSPDSGSSSSGADFGSSSDSGGGGGDFSGGGDSGGSSGGDF